MRGWSWASCPVETTSAFVAQSVRDDGGSCSLSLLRNGQEKDLGTDLREM